MRVLDSNGSTVGVGVLVGQQEILTCAHVVNTACGRDRQAQEPPGGEIIVEPADGSGPLLRARVHHWLPPPRPGAVGDDIAGLVLIDTEVFTRAVPVRLAANPPVPGQTMRVFGYPGIPPRPNGVWVEVTARGVVGGGHLQLDSTTQTALRVQPGFSGSPVYDGTTGRMVGLLATAPLAASGERDSYAITAKQLRKAWREVLDYPHRTRDRRRMELTILHMSDLRFGSSDIFGGNGLVPVDEAGDILFRWLHDDLEQLAENRGIRPDLIVVTGDLSAGGLPSEYDQVMRFLAVLSEAVELPRQHVAIVPGNHDVNGRACEAYFLSQSAGEREPMKPYWPKWEYFAKAFEQFYAGIDGVTFTPDQPWSLFEMPDLAVVVAGLNSTITESHLDDDHYGWIGEYQLHWFADQLADYRRRGWLRLAAVHHNAVGGAVAHENLRDAYDLDECFGRPGLANLLLHGHSPDGRPQQLSSSLLALSTGSSAVTREDRPQEFPNRYQLLTISPGGVTRYLRRYAVSQRCWIGDTQASTNGWDWRPYPLQHVHTTFPSDQHEVFEPSPPPDGPGHFFNQVWEATKASHPGATVVPVPRREAGYLPYLRVSLPLPHGGVEQWPVGVVDDEVTQEHLQRFLRVHRLFASADPSVRSVLVYRGGATDPELVAGALRHGVRLRSFVDYQGLIDLSPLVQRQDERLATDSIYPAALYVTQRYNLLADPDDDVHDDLLRQIIEWLGADNARFVMVLGDFGLGKTFLLRQLARNLRHRLPHLQPVLVELRRLQRGPSLYELLAQHLVQQNVDTFDVQKLQYMIRSGRVALLFDGFDELELRIGYDNAADYLRILLDEVTGNAKVVLTSRTQHFRSSAQIRTLLGDQVTAQVTSRVAVLEDFTDEQILQFLAKRYAGNENAAQARFELLGDVRDMRGLSGNPRMLAFIAGLDEQRLRAVRTQHGRVSAAGLYQELVNFWLVWEAGRDQRPGGPATLDEEERLAACTALALRLWETTALTIPMTQFTVEVSNTLTRLAELGYTVDEATHTVGLGTLLVRTPEGEFAFVHRSVMEWLVARSEAEKLRNGQIASTLLVKRMSKLMLDFVCDLAGHRLARGWAADVLADPAASQVAKQNALAVARRLGPGQYQVLAGVDLRNEDLTNRDLRNANLQGADLRGMRLTGTDFTSADLRNAKLTGVRMVGGNLANAQLAGSQWNYAALLGVSGLDNHIATPELAVAAVADRDPADVMISPTGHVSSLAFCPNGALLALTRGPSIEIIDMANRHPLRVLSGHAGGVTGVAFSPDGALLASASNDRAIRLWDSATGQLRTTLTGHTNWLREVAFSPDGALLASASDDGTIRLWDPATGQHRRTLTGHTHGLRRVAFSPDGALLASASNDRTIRLWDPATGQLRTTLTGHTGGVTGVAFSPDGTLLASASDDGTIRLWDPATSQPHTIYIGRPIAPVIHPSTPQQPSPFCAIAISPAKSLLAAGSADRTISLLEIKSRLRWRKIRLAHRRTLTGHTNYVNAVAFSPDGRTLASGSGDQTVRLWNVTDPAHSMPLDQPLTGHTESVTAVAFSPDGRTLASASNDGTIRLWNPATGQHRNTLTGHTGGVRGIMFSPDGTQLASASNDGTIRLWNPATGAARATLLALAEDDYAVFLPDGSYKLKGDPGRAFWWAIKLCRFTPGELVFYHPAIHRLPADMPLPNPETGSNSATSVTGD